MDLTNFPLIFGYSISKWIVKETRPLIEEELLFQILDILV